MNAPNPGEPSTSEQQASEHWKRQYAEIAQLAGGLAHEIRNPLSTIRLNVELLGEQLTALDHPEARRMEQKASRIEAECQRLDQILGAFLQFATAGRIEAESHDLSTLVSQFVAFFEAEAQDKGVEVRSHLAAGLPPVCVDEALLRQVFGNLARNALEAMPNGGLLEVATYADDDGQVILELIDNGCGMTPAQQERMFDVFYTAGKSSGSGLGLPTVRKIVEAHGGSLSCESEVGQGTRFRVEFPNGSRLSAKE